MSTYSNLGFKSRVSVLAGSGNDGKEDGEPERTSFDGPFGVAVDAQSRSCFVADQHNSVIRRISGMDRI